MSLPWTARIGIAERLDSLRESSGLSEAALTRVCGLSGNNLNVALRRLRDESRVRADIELGTVRAIAEALGVSLDWLIRGEGPEPEPEAVRAAVERARVARAEAAEPEVAA